MAGLCITGCVRPETRLVKRNPNTGLVFPTLEIGRNEYTKRRYPSVHGKGVDVRVHTVCLRGDTRSYR